MKNLNKILKTTIFCILILFSLSPIASAQTPTKTETKDYTVLAPLPGIGSNADKTTNLKDYLPAAFNLTVGIAVGLAFVMITFGGITYAVSDSFTGKDQGKTYVTNAVYGLLLVIGAYVILYTINPKILSFDLSIPRPEIKAGVPTVTSGNGLCEPPNCQTLNSIGLAGVTSGSAVGKGVSPVLGDKLVRLDEYLKSAGITWRITEAYPPSRVHKASCHTDGTCIDANVSPDAKSLTTFINSASRANLKAIYEVETDAQKDALVKAGVRSVNILVLPPIDGKRQITAPHFSVYNQ